MFEFIVLFVFTCFLYFEIIESIVIIGNRKYDFNLQIRYGLFDFIFDLVNFINGHTKIEIRTIEIPKIIREQIIKIVEIEKRVEIIKYVNMEQYIRISENLYWDTTKDFNNQEQAVQDFINRLIHIGEPVEIIKHDILQNGQPIILPDGSHSQRLDKMIYHTDYAEITTVYHYKFDELDSRSGEIDYIVIEVKSL